ncbi:MAG: hypothetical protein DWG82_03565 [Chloroflexi bacterium]|nr:hypothetical protein [Chloroflexota bacterium]
MTGERETATERQPVEDSTTGPVTPAELLRQALVDDQDPRFPAWLPLPGIGLGLGWAAYQFTTGDAGVLPTLGISAAIFAGTTVATWLGWQLEID